MARELYESTYQAESHFSFGANWRDFLSSLTEERIGIAKKSLETFLGVKDLKGKTFIDVGCGSGIFSLSAHLLGAGKVVSLDVDNESIACAEFLRDKYGRGKNWQVRKASALNAALAKNLGQFDVVYSWGVLHHTGNMYRALENTAELVKDGGQLYVSIYNDNRTAWLHGTSRFWEKVKHRYNHSSQATKSLLFALYSSYLFLGLIFSGKNPFRYITGYKLTRGMSWKHDIIDWLGGYPYEYASSDKIVEFFAERSFVLEKLTLSRSIGCNEYLFLKEKPIRTKPTVTALMSVHNNAKSLDKSLESIAKQSYRTEILCINDASTDQTPEVLRKWQKKLGSQMKVITNPKNLGLTKSLNKGLKAIRTTYTARIDADDWWEPKKIEKQLNFSDVYRQYGLIGCWYTNHGHQVKHRVQPPVDDSQIRSSIIKRNPFAHSCVMFKTKLIQDLGGYDEKVRYGQDYELWLRCFNLTKFHNLPENLCHRSITSGISIEKQKDQMRQAVKTQIKYIRRYHLSPINYFYVLEPWLVSVTPRFLADWKRRLSDR